MKPPCPVPRVPVRLAGHRRSAGFTLIEIMMAVAILGILAAVALPNYRRYQLKSRLAEVHIMVGGIETGQLAFFGNYDDYANVTRSTPAASPSAAGLTWPAWACPGDCSAGSPHRCTEFDCIGFASSGSTYFIYRSPHAVGPGGAREFCIGARGDLDDNGDELNFEYQSDNDGDGRGNPADCGWSSRNGCEPNSLFPNELNRCDPEDW